MPRILLVTGIFLCPVVIDLGANGPFDTVKVAALWVFAVAALGLWFMEIVQGRTRFVPFNLAVPAGLFVLAIGASTAFSRTPIVSFFGGHSRNSGFIQYALYAAIFFLIAQLYWRRPDRLKELIYGLGAASSVVVAYILVQRFGLDPVRWGLPGGSRPRVSYFGTLGNSNFAGGFLGATSPWLLFALWRAQRPRWRGLVVAWSALSLWALLLTESRGGLAAFVAATLVAAVAFRSRFPRRLLLGAAALALVLGLAAVAILLRPSASRPEVAVPGSADILRTETFEFRWVWWRAAVSIFAANPVLGTGPDTFITVYPQHKPVEKGEGRKAPPADEPHNVFLDHAASMGILGVGAYAALVITAMVWGFRRMARMDRPHGDLLGAFLALVAGYGGQAFFSIDIIPLAMLVWIGLGGVAALADPRLVGSRKRWPARDEGPPPRMSPARWSAVAVIALVTAVVVVAGLAPWRAERAIKEARMANRSGAFADAKRGYERALALFPFDPVNHGSYVNALLGEAREREGADREATLRQAVEHIERMNEIQPGFHGWKIPLGDALSKLGLLGDRSLFYEAYVVFEEATELAPQDGRVYRGYADMLNRWGRAEGRIERHCLALEKVERALELGRGDARNYRTLAVTYIHLGQLDRALAAVQRSLILDSDSQEAFRLREQVLERRERGGTQPVSC